ncbi:MAG: HEAT repeat domain-containing protein [Candidatus Woesearchaeota archaeon]|nr:HEAT repeat domain-containing protein [Candidatus Woesearchaeota archaeon]
MGIEVVTTHIIDLNAIANDVSNTPERRSAAIILLGEKQEDIAATIKYSTADESYLRLASARALGSHKGRKVFEPLLALMADTDYSVRHEAILGLGVSKDSRAIFSLINYLQNPLCETSEAKRRVFMAFDLLNDPRARDFMLNYGAARINEVFYGREEPCPVVFHEIKSALHSKKPVLSVYTFYGKEDLRIKAEEKKGTLIQSLRDIVAIEKQIRDVNSFNHPQTYVVDLDGNLLLGGHIQEHVQVASGKDILAAGEALLEFDNGWHLRMLNNRSNGYYPDKSTISLALEKFKQAGLVDEKTVTEDFPKQGYDSEELLFDKPFYHKTQ